MSNRRKSYKNLIFSALGQIVTILVGLIVPRLFLVNYGSEVNGLIASVTQALVYVSLFEAGVGAATMQALYAPVAKEDWDAVNGILSATNLYYRKTGRWYLICLIALSLVYPLFVKSALPFYTVSGIVLFSGLGNVVMFYFQGKYRFFLQVDGKGYVLTTLGTLTLLLVNFVKVFLLLRGENIVLILAATFAISCLQVGYTLWYMRRNYPQVRTDVLPDYQAIWQKNYALVHQISGLIFNNTDVLILTVATNLKVVSVYSLFKMVTTQLDSILGILPGSIRFVMGQLYQTDKPHYIRRLDLLESYYSAIVYALYSVALFLFLPFMALYTSGVSDINYIDAKLARLFVLVALLSQSRIFANDTVDYAGHYRQTLSRTIAESTINLLVSLVGVHFWGIYGVLFGTVVALAYRTNDFILYANHRLLSRSARNTYSIYIVNIAVFGLMQSLFPRIFTTPINSLLRFVEVGIGATILSLVGFILAQTLLFPHCRRFIKDSLAAKKIIF